jgi:hypothetical protein
VVARVNGSYAAIISFPRRPTSTPGAGLSLIVIRPDTELRGVLTGGCLPGDWAYNDVAKQTHVSKAGNALRAEDLIQLLL